MNNYDNIHSKLFRKLLYDYVKKTTKITIEDLLSGVLGPNDYNKYNKYNKYYK